LAWSFIRWDLRIPVSCYPVRTSRKNPTGSALAETGARLSGI